MNEESKSGDLSLSDYQRTVEKLRITLQRQELILNSLRQGILITSDQGGVEFVNQAFCDLFNLNESPAQIIGLSSQEIIALIARKNNDPISHVDRVREILVKGQPVFGEEMIFPDGRTIMRDFIPVVFEGRQNGRIWFHYDITERKRMTQEKAALEAQNRQLLKAESLGRMAGAIAHHFNNQLQAVIMSLQMAEEEANRLLAGTEASEHLKLAMRSAGRLAELSGDMLTYLGQTPAKHERLNLSELCRNSLPVLRLTLLSATALESDFPANDLTINGDEGQLLQALANLVINAMEASGKDPDKQVRLTLKLVAAAHLPATGLYPVNFQPQSQPYVCLEIADKGVGIAEKDVEQLFDPFFSRKFTGRGLGLPVALGIVRAHQGAIAVESLVGQGSTFRIFLPAVMTP